MALATSFTFEGHGIRVYNSSTSNNIWIMASDTCMALGIYMNKVNGRANTTDFTKSFRKADVRAYQIERKPGMSGTGLHSVLFVSAAGLYKYLNARDKAMAKKFHNWFVTEVAPVMRGGAGAKAKNFEESLKNVGTIPSLLDAAKVVSEAVGVKMTAGRRVAIIKKHVGIDATELLCMSPSEIEELKAA